VAVCLCCLNSYFISFFCKVADYVNVTHVDESVFSALLSLLFLLGYRLTIVLLADTIKIEGKISLLAEK